MRFAGYELIDTLGAGSQGECYIASPPPRVGRGDDRVVLKVQTAPATEAARLRVADEFRRAASVHCPQICPLLEAGHVEGAVFSAIPYFPRGSLARPRLRPTRAEVLRACADAARAAHALHEAGIVHRSIKPANILLTDGGGALADIGLTHATSPGQTLAALGSVAAVEFVEPAALLGHPPGRASDIWSLGVTLHRALTSSSVYGDLPGDGVLGALRHVVQTPPVLADGLTDGEAALVAWCLSAERADRPATAALVAERLDRLAEAA